MSDQRTYVAGIPMDSLTYDDFETLMEALDALDTRANSEGFTQSLLGAMLAPSKDAAEKYVLEKDQQRKAKEHLQRSLKEKTAILRAKLILARRQLDSQEADRALNDARGE